MEVLWICNASSKKPDHTSTNSIDIGDARSRVGYGTLKKFFVESAKEKILLTRIDTEAHMNNMAKIEEEKAKINRLKT